MIQAIKPHGGINEARTPMLLYLNNLRPSGRRTMTTALKTISGLLCGGAYRMCPWHLVRHEHVSALRAVLQEKYAPATVNKHLTAIRGVLRSCWHAGILNGEDYRRAIDVPNVKGSMLPAGRMLTVHELSGLWEAAESKGPRYGALLSLLFSAGLRRSEAAALTWEDTNRETAADGSDTLWITLIGKGGKQRRVPLRGTAACRLQACALDAQRRTGLNRFGRILEVQSGRSVAKMLTRLTLRAGILNVSCHDLRRSFVSHALAGGADLATVSRMAGHSDPRTTARYDRRPDDAMEAAADGLPS